jgi:hypothetical protein
MGRPASIDPVARTAASSARPSSASTRRCTAGSGKVEAPAGDIEDDERRADPVFAHFRIAPSDADTASVPVAKYTSSPSTARASQGSSCALVTRAGLL